MPALTPVDNTLGALFIGTICSSVVYGVTWLQVYSYYTSHCQKDRWPLKSLVALLMAVDTLNVAFVTYTTYLEGVTNFGDYKSDARVPWGLPATALSAILLEIFVQHFYAWRVYKLNGGSLYLPAAISSVSLAAFGVGTVFCVELFEHPGDPESHYKRFSITTMACKTLCDVLITIGMLSALSGKHSQLRRTNGVLNLMAIYAINCGTANLVLAILCLSVLIKFPNTLIYAPFFFIMVRLYFCAFMAILNSRESVHEKVEGPDPAVVTLTQFKAGAGTDQRGVVDSVTDTSGDTAAQKSLPRVSAEASFSESVIAFDREKYPTPAQEEVFT